MIANAEAAIMKPQNVQPLKKAATAISIIQTPTIITRAKVTIELNLSMLLKPLVVTLQADKARYG